MYGIIIKGDKLAPDIQFRFCTCYHHLEVSKPGDLDIDLLRFKGHIPYRSTGVCMMEKQQGKSCEG